VTVSAPPRPKRTDDRGDRSVVDARREQEALIEEARRRARRRRQRNASFALVGATVAVVAIGFARGSVHTKITAGSSVPSGAGALTGNANGKLAYIAGTLRQPQLQVVNPDGSELHVIAQCQRLHDGCAVAEPAWSPDGAQIAYVSGRLGLAEFPHGQRGPLRWHPTVSLYVKHLDSGAVRRLAGCGSCVLSQDRISWSPDGSWIVFSRGRGLGAGETGSLWLVDATSGKLRRLTDCSPEPLCTDVSPAWSPNGDLIVFSRITNQNSDLYTVRPDGSQLTKITNSYSAASPQWSPNGQRIAYGTPGAIVVINADGSHPKLLDAGTPGSGPGVPSWSPDGTKLAFFNFPDPHTVEVWTTTTNGYARNRIYHSVGVLDTSTAAIWSPDGTKLAFAATSGPRSAGTFLVNADGTGLHRLSSGYAAALAWQRLR
jgi:Tol biopolymer transport system component